MMNAPLGKEGMVVEVRLNHINLSGVIFEMPLDQGKRTASDGAEPDDDDWAVDLAVIGIAGHGWLLCLSRPGLAD